MSRLLDVYTIDVSNKTVWIWFRLIDSEGRDGVGEATLNNRADDVLAALPAAIDAFSGSSLGVSAKLLAVRKSAPGVIGRVIASALEQSWLDLEGQRTGQPIFALLGGHYRTSVASYANINRGTVSRSPAEFSERAATAIADGYGAIKLAPFDDVTPHDTDENRRRQLIDAGFERISAVAERLGGTGRVQVDCHSRFRPDEAAVILDRLAVIGVSWFEEPILEHEAAFPAIAGLRARAQERNIVLAGAEQAAGLAEFEPYCHAGCYDVIMPDIILAGGPSEVVRIGCLAEAVGQAVSLHNPSGPLMDMHSAHVAAAVPQLHSLERQFRESNLYDELVERRHRFAGGCYHLGDSPGLGLSVDWNSSSLKRRYSEKVGL
jgi:galactonate dehydratase